MDNLKLLNNLYKHIKDKNRAAIKLFKENALSEEHYRRFARAHPLSYKTRVRRIGEYIVLRPVYRHYTKAGWRPHHGICIIAIDDTTNKLFCHPLPWRSEFEEDSFLEGLTEQKIRELMGFTIDFRELNRPLREGDKIRVQGDLVMIIYRIYKGVDEICEEEVINRYKTALSDLKYEIASKIEKKIKEIWNNNENKENAMKKIRSYLKDELGEEAYNKYIKRQRLRYKNELYITAPLIYRILYNVPDIFFRKVDKKTLEKIREEIKKKVKKEIEEEIKIEKERTIYIGNHVITLISPNTPYDNNFLLLHSQKIIFKHREHGTLTLEVPSPARISFRLLDIHPMYRSRNID